MLEVHEKWDRLKRCWALKRNVFFPSFFICKSFQVFNIDTFTACQCGGRVDNHWIIDVITWKKAPTFSRHFESWVCWKRGVLYRCHFEPCQPEALSWNIPMISYDSCCWRVFLDEASPNDATCFNRCRGCHCYLWPTMMRVVFLWSQTDILLDLYAMVFCQQKLYSSESASPEVSSAVMPLRTHIYLGPTALMLSFHYQFEGALSILKIGKWWDKLLVMCSWSSLIPGMAGMNLVPWKVFSVDSQFISQKKKYLVLEFNLEMFNTFYIYICT